MCHEVSRAAQSSERSVCHEVSRAAQSSERSVCHEVSRAAQSSEWSVCQEVSRDAQSSERTMGTCLISLEYKARPQIQGHVGLKEQSAQLVGGGLVVLFAVVQASAGRAELRSCHFQVLLPCEPSQKPTEHTRDPPR